MKDIYNLSEQEKERIYLAREELKNGQTISHKVVQKEIDHTLSIMSFPLDTCVYSSKI